MKSTQPQILRCIVIAEINRIEHRREKTRRKSQKNRPNNPLSSHFGRKKFQVMGQRGPNRNAVIPKKHIGIDETQADDLPARKRRIANQTLNNSPAPNRHRKQIGKSTRRRVFRNSKIGNIEKHHLKNRKGQRKPHIRNKPHDKNRRKSQPHKRETVRDKTIVFGRPTAFHRRLKHPAQMPPSNPHGPQREKHKSSMGFQQQNLIRICLLTRITHRIANAVDKSFFQNRKESKRPKRKKNIEIAQIGQPNNGRHNTQPQRREMFCENNILIRDTHRIVDPNMGQIGRKIRDDIININQQYNQNTHPEDAIFEHRGNALLTIKTFGQRDGKSHQRKSQLFGIFPLPLKNNRDTKRSHHKRDRQAEPPAKRAYPTDPRNALARRQTLVKGRYRPLRHLGQYPPGHNVEKKLLPSVFRRGIISRGTDNTAPIRSPSRNRNRPHDPRHAINQDEFRTGKRNTGPKKSENEIDANPSHKRQQHRHRELRLDQRAIDEHHARVIGISIEQDPRSHAQYDRPHGNKGTFFFGYIS